MASEAGPWIIHLILANPGPRVSPPTYPYREPSASPPPLCLLLLKPLTFIVDAAIAVLVSCQNSLHLLFSHPLS